MSGAIQHGTFSLLLLPMLVFSQPAKGETVEVVSMVLGDGLQLADHSGFYGEIITEVLDKSGTSSNSAVYPFKRALKVFFSAEADCIWGLDTEFLKKFRDDPGDLIQSSLVLNSQQCLFSIPGHAKISSMNGLSGMAVGVLNGANTEKMFKKFAAQVVKLRNQEAKFDMLLAGRVDAIGGWIPDIYITMKTLGIDSQKIEPLFPLSSSGVRIVCRESPETKAFLEATNVAIADFIEAEKYSDIRSEYGIPLNVK
ncbi:substrate-binding periplasmic protein [Pseudophaeobacter leonis]|uniref:substrate-binding periplasmic protein n=1 Tax=Pseudophaeobacter leonis TaxID=1144477 RepID=UPI0009F2983A|nr:transporter substrate-binding domain-containing protein [Pseudophaeobacter leonis]